MSPRRGRQRLQSAIRDQDDGACTAVLCDMLRFIAKETKKALELKFVEF